MTVLNISIIQAYPMGFKYLYLFVVLLFEVDWMAKVRLFVRARKKQGAYIASVPVRQLKKLSCCSKTRWSFQEIKDSNGESVVGGWLILEAL